MDVLDSHVALPRKRPPPGLARQIISSDKQGCRRVMLPLSESDREWRGAGRNARSVPAFQEGHNLKIAIPTCLHLRSGGSLRVPRNQRPRATVLCGPLQCLRGIRRHRQPDARPQRAGIPRAGGDQSAALALVRRGLQRGHGLADPDTNLLPAALQATVNGAQAQSIALHLLPANYFLAVPTTLPPRPSPSGRRSPTGTTRSSRSSSARHWERCASAPCPMNAGRIPDRHRGSACSRRIQARLDRLLWLEEAENGHLAIPEKAYRAICPGSSSADQDRDHHCP